MNKKYVRALSLVENTFGDIKKIYDKVDNDSFEDIKACQAVERLIEHLESFIGEIKYYSKDTMAGHLSLGSNGRYSINSTELTCGYPIEVYNAEYDQWEGGRVEHSSKYGGYYFKNYDGSNISLSNDIWARIRV